LKLPKPEVRLISPAEALYRVDLMIFFRYSASSIFVWNDFQAAQFNTSEIDWL
jgi:hypothetical protein